MKVLVINCSPVRTGATADNFARLFDSIALESTPYAALRNGGEYVFSHVPVGIFNIVAEDSLLATVSLENGSTSDTLFHVPGITHEFVFEDFDDGDSLNNLAKIYPNYGWYFSTTGNVRWIRPDSSVDYKKALIDDSTKGKILSLKFDIKDFGYVLIGTHLGRDTAYYDLSNLTAIRLKVRGDCDLGIALEHYREVGNNTYRKALWNAKASKEWTEIVLRPGKEVLDNESLQVPWTDVSKEIGIFSIFASNGTFIELDEIVFEGIDPDSLKN